jgi:hypothetical protein
MTRDILLPPAVLDLIEQSRRDISRSTIATQDHILARLENIEAACRAAADDIRRRRRRLLETTSR